MGVLRHMLRYLGHISYDVNTYYADYFTFRLRQITLPPPPLNVLVVTKLVMKALDHYRRAVASDPENVTALFCKAVVSGRRGEFFDALKVCMACGWLYGSVCSRNQYGSARNSRNGS